MIDSKIIYEAEDKNSYITKLQKEISDYIKDIAKQFKVTGNNTEEILKKLESTNASNEAKELRVLQRELTAKPQLGKFPSDIKIEEKNLTEPKSTEKDPAVEPDKKPEDKPADASTPPPTSEPDKKPEDKPADPTPTPSSEPKKDDEKKDDAGQLKEKYKSFINDVIVGKNLKSALSSIKIIVNNTLDPNDNRSHTTNNGVVAFKIYPNKSYYFKAKVPMIETTLGAGSTDPEFLNLRRRLATKYPKYAIDEAVQPLSDVNVSGNTILLALANFYAKQYTGTKGENTYNPDKKIMSALAEDYFFLFDIYLDDTTKSISKSWGEFIDIAIQIRSSFENDNPEIKQKAFGSIVNQTKAIFEFGIENKNKKTTKKVTSVNEDYSKKISLVGILKKCSF